MLTCLCDAFYGNVGIATVKVLEHLGCQVNFDERQTCCGQPPFNAGDWKQARTVATYAKEILFSDNRTVVTPSASCAAMTREGYHLLFPDKEPAHAFELSEFIVKELGITTWSTTKSYNKKIAFHRACHGRGIGLTNEAEQLIASIPGVELVTIKNAEQCCGFGGAFCVVEPHLSGEIGHAKVATLLENEPDEIVSGDMGCLMHLGGILKKDGNKIPVRHYAEILAEMI
jgi:L-lactate dehydrogenase complex protein LldE